MKFIKLICVVFLGVGLFSCDQFKVTTTDKGDRIIVHEKGDSEKIGKEGDILTFNLVIKSDQDSVFRDSFKDGKPVTMPLQKGSFKGSFESGLFNVSEGDSTTILVNADSLFTLMQQPVPKGVSKGSDLKFIVKMISIQTPEEYQKTMALKSVGELKSIEDFVKKSMVGAQKSDKGIYFLITKAGSGATPAKGDTVSVNYVGKFMDGKTFDQSQPGKPLEFPIGMGYVIPGWDATIESMKVGEKRTVIIPSSLAYGEAGAGNTIPGSTPLVFDMELIKVKK